MNLLEKEIAKDINASKNKKVIQKPITQSPTQQPPQPNTSSIVNPYDPNTINMYHVSQIACEDRLKYFPQMTQVCQAFNPDQMRNIANGQKTAGTGNFSIQPQYQTYYKNYQANVGDYFCKLNDTNQCITQTQPTQPIQQIRPIQQVKKANDIKLGNLEEIKEPKLYIDSIPFYECQDNDPMCISDIYTANNFGLPENPNIPNVNNKLYKETFDEQINKKKIISCPAGYIFDQTDNICKNSANNKKCIPAEYSNQQAASGINFCEYRNGLTNLFVEEEVPQFKNEKQCFNWCAKNPNCKSVVRTLDRNGNVKCKYYRYNTNNNQIQMITDKTGVILNKREFPYVANPPQNMLRINTSDCLASKYGCCADGRNLVKVDANGSNCAPFLPKTGLIGSPNAKLQFNSLGGTTNLGKIRKDTGNFFSVL